MAYRNKTYVAFDGDVDMHFYRTMLMWKQSDNTTFDFYNAHDLNSANDSSTEESIKRKLKERMVNSKVFVLLVGENTKNLFKFVRWEIEQAIKLDLPIIVVNLPELSGIESYRKVDHERCPALAKKTLSIHVSFKSKIMQFALEKWPSRHITLRRDNYDSPRYYASSIYESLGL